MRRSSRILYFVCFILSALLLKTSAYSYCTYGPLSEASVRVAVYGGVVPTYFSHKSDNLYLSSHGIGGIVATGSSFNFFEQSHWPWTIGMDVGYVSTQYAELFMGISYVKSTGRTHHFEVDELHSKFTFKSYSDVGLWGGMRFYFIGADLCGTCYFDPFIGFKAGVKFYNKQKADYRVKHLGFFEENLTYYQKEAVPALGMQLGFTFNFFDCVDMVVMGEAIWAGPLRNNNKIFLGSKAGHIHAVSVGETGTLWSFPITVGVVLNL